MAKKQLVPTCTDVWMWEDWPLSIKHLVRTYYVHRIGIGPGRLKEAHKKAPLGEDRKRWKKDHVLRWEQVPGDNTPPRRIRQTLRRNNNADGGRGRGKSAY